MKALTTYYRADGTQIAVYFTPVMTITQDADGSYSHRGTTNMDEGGKDAGIDTAFAPFDGTITWKQTTGDMTGILFSSDTLVWTVKYGLVYVNILMWHDNDTSDLFKGKKIKQGQPFYQEGTAGRATGNHIHYGVSIGKFPGGYPLVKNEFGNWELPNEVYAWDIFFVNDTIIRNGKGHPWQVYTEPEPVVIPPEPVVEPEPTPEPTEPLPIEPKPLEQDEPIKMWDRVRIVGTHFPNGLLIPDFLKRRVFVVVSPQRYDKLGPKVQLRGLMEWFYIKDLRKIN